MTKKNWLLIALAVALASVYVIYFTDWFKPKTMRIFYTTRNLGSRRPRAGGEPNLIFDLNRPFRLTEIKVIPLAEWQTNRHALPLWHLVSDSNSIPVKLFHYGWRIPGMKPAVAGQRAEPLETNVIYRLFVTSGGVKGQRDFELGGKIPDTNSAAN